MDFQSRMVEERIREAQAEGRFDDLEGRGKPLRLDDEAPVPDDLRLAFKILKNASCLPPEVELGKELANLGTLLTHAVDDDERARLVREINRTVLKINLSRKVPVRAEIGEVLLDRRPETAEPDDPTTE